MDVEPKTSNTTAIKKIESKDKQNIYMLFNAYAQSINRLKKESAARVLDYWFAWTGVDFFKLLIGVRILILKLISAFQFI